MTTSEWVILAAIVLYMIMMIAIGVGVSRKTKTSDDFYLGGRKLGPLVTAMSAEASDMSAYLLMGIPGLALMCGLAEATWTAIGLAVGTYLNWLFVAKRLRIYSEKIGAVTVPSFFSRRFSFSRRFLTTRVSASCFCSARWENSVSAISARRLMPRSRRSRVT